MNIPSFSRSKNSRPPHTTSGSSNLLLIFGLLLLIAIASYSYTRIKNKPVTTTQQTISQTNEAAANTYDYTNWNKVTFMPDNVSIKIPKSISVSSTIQQPTDSTAAVVNLENGYSLYVSQITDPSINLAYGNLSTASYIDTFTLNGRDVYLVSDGVSISISTCKDKICSLQSNTDKNMGILISIYYRDPKLTGQQAPDGIPIKDFYVATLYQILKSVSY